MRTLRSSTLYIYIYCSLRPSFFLLAFFFFSVRVGQLWADEPFIFILYRDSVLSFIRPSSFFRGFHFHFFPLFGLCVRWLFASIPSISHVVHVWSFPLLARNCFESVPKHVRAISFFFSRLHLLKCPRSSCAFYLHFILWARWNLAESKMRGKKAETKSSLSAVFSAVMLRRFPFGRNLGFSFSVCGFLGVRFLFLSHLSPPLSRLFILHPGELKNNKTEIVAKSGRQLCP